MSKTVYCAPGKTVEIAVKVPQSLPAGHIIYGDWELLEWAFGEEEAGSPVPVTTTCSRAAATLYSVVVSVPVGTRPGSYGNRTSEVRDQDNRTIGTLSEKLPPIEVTSEPPPERRVFQSEIA